MQLILASASPRRQKILEIITRDFTVVVSGSDESLVREENPAKLVEELSFLKAKTVLEANPHALVIGADTIVVKDGEIMGKPKNDDDAFRMLSKLSNSTHHVFTGVTILKGNIRDSFFVDSSVNFFCLSEKEILDYIKTGEPRDKAGAYGISGRGVLFVESICGDFYSVCGLPVAMLKRHLENLGFTCTQQKFAV